MEFYSKSFKILWLIQSAKYSFLCNYLHRWCLSLAPESLFSMVTNLLLMITNCSGTTGTALWATTLLCPLLLRLFGLFSSFAVIFMMVKRLYQVGQVYKIAQMLVRRAQPLLTRRYTLLWVTCREHNFLSFQSFKEVHYMAKRKLRFVSELSVV